LNEKDKEKLILRLLDEEKPWNIIAKIAHCSASTIQKVRDRKVDPGISLGKSNRTRALILYKNLKIFDVMIELDIPFEEAERYRIEFWRARHLDELEQIYMKNRSSMPQLLSFCYEKQAVDDLKMERWNLLGETQNLNNFIAKQEAFILEAKKTEAHLASQIAKMTSEIRNLRIDKDLAEIALETFEDSVSYQEFYKNVSHEVWEILGDKNKMIYAAILAVNRALPQGAFISSLDGTISSIISNCESTLHPDSVNSARMIYSEFIHTLVKIAIPNCNLYWLS
jgi:hypothetical protein